MTSMKTDGLNDRLEGLAPASHEDEARERWGGTEAFRESVRRTRRYTKADWERYRAESDALMGDAAALLVARAAPDGEDAMAVAERHRLSIDRWFYPCSPTMHAQLADLYERDARFASGIDRFAAGLTPWWSTAIRANARR
jgi:hypothetical protein